MMQARPIESSSWRPSHPSDISPGQWRDWLGHSTRPSPYFLPEWGLYWERVWPNTQAEVWLRHTPDHSVRGLIAVRRKRLGCEWVFAQPWGTPGGWLGGPPPNNEDADLIRNLLTAVENPKTVQVTLSLDTAASEVSEWRLIQHETAAWILDLRGTHDPELQLDLSSAHRRNIAKGAQHEPVIMRVEDTDAIARLLATWTGKAGRESRIVLNQGHAPVFASMFLPTGALHWWIAYAGEKPVATTLWLALHDQAVYVDGAFDRDTLYAGINHHLFHQTLLELFRTGVRYFDFGAGPLGQTSAGLAQFKEGWGARPHPRLELIYRRPWYHRLRTLI